MVPRDVSMYSNTTAIDDHIAVSQENLWYDPAFDYEFRAESTYTISIDLWTRFGVIGFSDSPSRYTAKYVYGNDDSAGGILVEPNDL